MRSVTKNPHVAEHCDVNILSLFFLMEPPEASGTIQIGCGHGSLVVKLMDSWRVMSSSPVPLKIHHIDWAAAC
ncbi:hypothetical protein TNCV_1236791 [Trichonephila clavipes]|nr:hypothetical protein TNCV_1236791 [Trichonephila clavipes]